MKNFHKKLTISIFIIFLLQVSCNNMPVFTKGQYIMKFEKFVSTTEDNYKTFDDNDWENTNLQFNELSKIDYCRFKEELTEYEQSKIDRLIGHYYSLIVKYNTEQAQKKVRRICNQAKGFIDNLSK